METTLNKMRLLFVINELLVQPRKYTGDIVFCDILTNIKKSILRHDVIGTEDCILVVDILKDVTKLVDEYGEKVRSGLVTRNDFYFITMVKEVVETYYNLNDEAIIELEVSYSFMI